MSYTSGDWIQYGTIIYSVDHGVICELSEIHRQDRHVIHERLDIGSGDWDEAMANGCLIAAAPKMLLRLKEARKAIASLEPDALGMVTDGYLPNGPNLAWPIRDELLSHIDDAIAAAASRGMVRG